MVEGGRLLGRRGHPHVPAGAIASGLTPLDPRRALDAEGESDQRSFIVRPVVPLGDRHRYIIAIHKVRSETAEILPSRSVSAAGRSLVRIAHASSDDRSIRSLDATCQTKLSAAEQAASADATLTTRPSDSFRLEGCKI